MFATESPLLTLERGGRFEITPQSSRPKTSYFQFDIVFPVFIEAQMMEMNDREVIQFAESAGSFAFLNSPEEDIYNDLAKKTE
ncbi:MAG: hypothetical protein ABSE90_13850 [Verrucomicrobiota bacterium]|jgi:hypothetical protein